MTAVRCEAVFFAPEFTFAYNIPSTITVETAVGNVGRRVAEQAAKLYDIESLDSSAFHANCTPRVTAPAQTTLGEIGTCLTILIQPDQEQATALRNARSEMQKLMAKTEEENASLRELNRMLAIKAASNSKADEELKPKPQEESLDERLAKFEQKFTGLMKAQAAKIDDQAVKIDGQAAELKAQKVINRDQAAELKAQKAINRDHAAQRKEQEAINRDQAAKIEGQAAKIEGQAAKIEGQAAKIEGQAARIEGQAAELKAQKVINRDHAAKRKEQEAINRDQAAKIEDLEAKIEDLEAKVEDQDAKLAAEVRSKGVLCAEFKTTVEELTRKVNILTPLHLRVLLDVARSKVLSICGYDDWEAFRGARAIDAFQVYIAESLAASTTPATKISPTAIYMICGHNVVRRAGNRVAHVAEKEDIWDAVERMSSNRQILENIFKFAYGA